MAVYETLTSVNDYNTSQLAHWFLSRVPRLGTNFQALHNLTLENGDYSTSMAMYGVLAAIAFAVGSLLLLCWCCCNIVMFRAWPKYGESPKSTRRCMSPVKFTVLLLAILGASSFALGFVGEFKVHRVTNGVCDTVTFIHNRVHSIKHDIDVIVQQMNTTEIMEKVQKEMEIVKREIAQISPDSVASIKQYSEFLEKLQTEILQTKDSIKEKITGDILNKVLKIMDPINEQCPKVSQWSHLLSLLLVIFLVLSSLLFIVGLYRQCFRLVACINGYLVWLALFSIGTLAFVALIASSDFCVDGETNIDILMPTPVNDYYLLHCHTLNRPDLQCLHKSPEHFQSFDSNGTLSSPFDSSNANQLRAVRFGIPRPPPHLPSIPSFTNENFQIDVMVRQAGCFVNQSKAIMEQFGDDVSTTIASCNNSAIRPHGQSMSGKIDHLCKAIRRLNQLIIGPVRNGTNTNTTASKSSLLGRLEVASQCMGRIEANVDCSSVTPRISRHLGEICSTLFDAFFVYLVNSLIAIVLFFFLQLLSIWLICAHKDHDDPYTPSAPPSAHINPRVQSSLNMSEFVWKDARKEKRTRFASRQLKTTVL